MLLEELIPVMPKEVCVYMYAMLRWNARPDERKEEDEHMCIEHSYGYVIWHAHF